MLQDRRAPAAAHTNKSRFPLGTPTDTSSASHSHIRIIPRPDDEDSHNLEDEYDNWTPTFSSPSLLHPDQPHQQTQTAQNSIANEAATPKTFADMARRFGLRDTAETEAPSQPSSSVMGMIKFHPSRRANQDSWRSRQSSEIRGSDHNENATMVAERMKGLLPLTRSTTTSALSPAVYDNAPLMPEFAPAVNDRKDSGQHTFAAMDTEQQSNPTETHHDIHDRCAELFGKLPDPIRLHEETGLFDGQVVFIGHPNRDVSAHQWSTASFQWENIGRYSHARGKIEGSLASDRVQEQDTPRHALLSFKVAAENREKLIVDDGRPKEVDDVTRPLSRDSLETTTTDTKTENVHDHVNHRRTGGIALPVQTSPYHTIKKEHLEDPFVAKAKYPQVNSGPGDQVEHKKVDVKGSLDFRYEFPGRPDTPSHLSSSNATVSAVQERTPVSTSLVGSTVYAQPSQVNLREIDVGEEASGGVMFSFGQGIRPRKVPTASPETGGPSARPEENVYGDTGKWNIAAPPFQFRVSAPRLANLQPTARSLFPAAGMTIANPYRNVAQLDRTVARPPPASTLLPVSTPAASTPATLSVTPLLESTEDLCPSTTLHYSDPDGVGQSQGYEIANGLSQQPPTPQNFKGPFFTDSKPTTNDPTASLSVHIGEEEKLRTWFHDGHRPARQREYALNLTSAATSAGRSRHLGAIGESKGPSLKAETQNTLPFVRLYENLSEYIEEYHHGSGGSYFTRSWKPAPPHLRDLGPDGNNSFFSTGGTSPVLVQYQRSTRWQDNMPQRRSEATTVGGSTRFVPMYGTVGDGGNRLRKLGAHRTT